MPFTRISVKAGTSQERKRAMAKGVHEAMVGAILIPDDDYFQLVSEYAQGDFFFDPHFLGIDRSDDMVVVQITLRRGRSDAMKQKLYGAIASNLQDMAGVRPQDVFIYLSENDFSDWSVGNGQMSMSISTRAAVAD